MRRMATSVLSRGAALAGALALTAARPANAQYPTTPPPAAPLRPLQFPPFQEAALPNGLRLLVVENHELPVVSLSLALPAGTRFDPAAREGLAELVAELLTKGTQRRTAEQIAASIEGVGSSLSAAADADFLLLSTTVLTEHLDLAFDLVGDVTLHATFPESELELARTRTLSQLRIDQASPEALGNRFFAAAIYGNHPYGRRPSEASVKAIGAAEVRAFAAERLRPGGGLLVLSGDVTLPRARDLATRTFGTWTGAPPAAVPPPAPPARKPTGILLVHRPGSQQSNILIGNLAQRAGDPLYYPSVIANRILGGGADARLFLILREQKGWTYGAFSRIVRHRDRGHFMANAEVRTPVTDSALVELLRQLRRIRTEAVADSELVSAKGYLIGSFPRQIETPGQVAGQVTTVKLLGLGEEYLRTFRERLAAVTPADVARGARHTIHPDSAVIVVVGDGQSVYDKLKALAHVRIVDAEGKALTPGDLTK